MLEVVPTGCHQGGLQPLRPLVVGPGEPPHLIGSQAEVTDYRAERLAAVDGIEELLPYLGGEPLLRPGPSASSLIVGVRPRAEAAVAATVPACVGAVRRPPTHSREVANASD